MKEVIINTINYKIGQNAQENWDLLNLNPDFTWLHLKSFPFPGVYLFSQILR